MDFWKDLGRLHVFAKEIPCLTDRGAPTQRTEGAPGVLYMDTDTGALYKCRGGKEGAFRWESLLTEADKAELVSAVIQALGGSPVFGTVDESNNIVISGLADGSYTVKYEMADGSTLEIGELTLGSAGPAYTNLAEPNVDNTTDFAIWCTNARMGGDGSISARDGYTCTNFVAISPGDTIRIQGFKIERVGLYDADKTILPSGIGGVGDLNNNGYIAGDYSWTDESTTFTTVAGLPDYATVAYMRLSGWVNTTADAVIITRNEEIA